MPVPTLMAHRRMGPAVVAGLLAAVFLAPAAAGSAPSAPPTTAAASSAVLSLTVDPDTGLVDGDAVELTVDGFNAAVPFTLRQCRAGAIGPNDCSTRVTTSLIGVPGPLQGFVVVWALLDTPNGPVDCRVDACSIVLEQGGFATFVEASTGFDPAGPLLQPTVTVSSTTDLSDGDIVRITGTDFRPFDHVYIDQCVIGRGANGCDPRSSFILEIPISESLPLAETAAAAEAGVGFVHDQRVRAELETEDFQTVGCRPAACEVRVREDPGTAAFAFPLSFAEATGPVPTGPLPAAPALTG